MKTKDFDYILDKSFIAQAPVSPRDHSKLMVFNSSTGEVSHRKFYDISDYLNTGDTLVLNKSMVVSARILFPYNGKEREIFLLKKLSDRSYVALVRPGKIFKVGVEFVLSDVLSVKVLSVLEDGRRVLEFDLSDPSLDFDFVLESLGALPLPPYIDPSGVDSSSYQTVYADSAYKGSVAAPTAGLHFTDTLMTSLRNKGILFEELVLHVGLGTFLPVSSDDLKEHVMHEEDFELSSDVALRLNAVKSSSSRIIAVGTTSVRVLESSYDAVSGFVPQVASTDIFIYPGNYNWKAVDALISNFHLPKSTLIMLVASFLEHKGVKDPVKKVLELYELAKSLDYRFYSFGDAMFIF
jgi:S-adenosylmethionine:tRNA ribosyltransferase-isomerase